MRTDLDKRKRHELIRELIRTKPIGTQEELVSEIRGREINVTQTTVSRDLEEMQVGKWNGKYHIPFGESDSLAWFGTIRQQVTGYKKIGDHLIILKTKPGASGMVEKTFNDQHMPEIAGVVASGLTVMVAFESLTHQQVLLELLQKALD
jgi:transcriptional regulator of arginine metabolism